MAQTTTLQFGQEITLRGQDGESTLGVGELAWFERVDKLAYNKLRDAKVARDAKPAPTPDDTARVASRDGLKTVAYGALTLARQPGQDRAAFDLLVAARHVLPDGMIDPDQPIKDVEADGKLAEIGRAAQASRPASAPRSSGPRKSAVVRQQLDPQVMARMALTAYVGVGLTAAEKGSLLAYVQAIPIRQATADEAERDALKATLERSLSRLMRFATTDKKGEPKLTADGQPIFDDPADADDYAELTGRLAKLATAAAPVWGPEATPEPEPGPADQPKTDDEEGNQTEA